MENQILEIDSLQVNIEIFEKLFIQHTGLTTEDFKINSARNQRTSICGYYELHKVNDFRLREYRQGVKMLLKV